MTQVPLPLRSSRILATVVREYIHTGEPVASVVIARRGTLGVSSATVRNVLARLEEQGFVRQPHTSAGRVPTDRGYRFYVDLLLENRRAADRPDVADAIREAANDEPSIEGVLSHVVARAVDRVAPRRLCRRAGHRRPAAAKDRVRLARRRARARRDARRWRPGDAEGRGRRRAAVARGAAARGRVRQLAVLPACPSTRCRPRSWRGCTRRAGSTIA